jgi:L-malate glycosyltransferase
MSTRRVIHVLSSLQIGGAERLVVDLAGVQKGQGLEPLILSFGRDTDPLCAVAREQGIAVLSLGEVRSSIDKMRVLNRTLQEPVPTALHVHTPWCMPRLALLLPFFRGSVVYTRHGAHSYDSLYWRTLHRWVHQFVSHLTFVSEQSAAVHRETYKTNPRPHQVLQFGVNIPTGVSATAQSSRVPLQIACVGRLVEVKGQRYLIEALPLLKSKQSYEVHIFGDGPDRPGLESLAAGNPNVVFHGMVMDREEIYGQMDILVVTSSMEGRSLAIMEAMAHQVAVAATDIDGNTQLVQQGRTGLLFPYGDPQGLADVLDRLLDNPDLRNGLAKEAREVACKELSVDASARTLDALYWPS